MFHKRSVRWSVAGAVAAAVVLVIGLWPSGSTCGPGHNVAWGDVVRQIRNARSAHLHMVQRDPTLYQGKEIVADMYVKAPDLIRLEGPDPSTQRARVAIQDGHDCYILYPTEKQFVRVPENAIKSSVIEDHLAFLGAFPATGRRPDATTQPVLLGDQEMRLEFTGQQNRNGRNLQKYRMDVVDKLNPPAQEPTTHSYCWFDPIVQAVTLMTLERIVDGSPTEVQLIEISLDVDLSEDLFSLPSDYSEAAESVAARGLTEVAAAYDLAREQITSYRLVAWETRVPSWGVRPVVRAARDGERWRVDQTGSPALSIDTEFGILWNKLGPSANGVSIFADHASKTRILWDDGNIYHQQPGDDSNLNRYLLAGCGWPAWPSTLASALPDDSSQFRRLADRADRPGLIGIAYTRLATGPEYPARLAVLWIDPERDYLCVRYEDHWRNDAPWQDNPDWEPDEPLTDERLESRLHDSWREIVEFGRTSAGRWYPRRLRSGGASVQDGKRHVWGPTETVIQVDFAGPIAADFFNCPTDLFKRYDKR